MIPVLTMMAEGVQVNLQLVFIEQAVVSRGAPPAALHRPEVLGPARATRVFLQPLLLCSSVGAN